jgi:hypothetical protein
MLMGASHFWQPVCPQQRYRVRTCMRRSLYFRNS